MMLGWVWTIVSGFRPGGVGWVIANTVTLQPLIGIVSELYKKVDVKPVLLIIGGADGYYIGSMIRR
jgi:hypothetical protein